MAQLTALVMIMTYLTSRLASVQPVLFSAHLQPFAQGIVMLESVIVVNMQLFRVLALMWILVTLSLPLTSVSVKTITTSVEEVQRQNA